MRRGLLSGLLRRNIVGIDIGSSSVKVVELSANGKQGDFRLEKCASELIERSAVADGNLVNIDAVGNALKRAIAKAGIRSKEAVLAIPASLTESQTVSLPDNLTEDELFIQVESEANRLFSAFAERQFRLCRDRSVRDRGRHRRARDGDGLRACGPSA